MNFKKILKINLSAIIIVPSFFTLSCSKTKNAIGHYEMNNNYAYSKVFLNNEQNFNILPQLKRKSNDKKIIIDDKIKQLILDNSSNDLIIDDKLFENNQKFSYNGSKLEKKVYNEKFSEDSKEVSKVQFAYDFLASEYNINIFANKDEPDIIYDYSELKLDNDIKDNKYYFNQVYDNGSLLLSSDQKLNFTYNQKTYTNDITLYDITAELNFENLTYLLNSNLAYAKEEKAENDNEIFYSLVINTFELNYKIINTSLGEIENKNQETIINKIKEKNPNSNIDFEKDVDIAIDNNNSKARVIAKKDSAKYNGEVEVTFNLKGESEPEQPNSSTLQKISTESITTPNNNITGKLNKIFKKLFVKEEDKLNFKKLDSNEKIKEEVVFESVLPKTITINKNLVTKIKIIDKVKVDDSKEEGEKNV
ncbi:hypothetical protein [Spiroplasma tabanidicola]|uniref:Lipoprotein n=1 Tax=Spiroplasma tabanidicola TaxID=324079 RepID=A0A6I6C6U8_9MOLU|nr:hypothetical protein [Spiroplasma tabanidicola]QGS51920.1 hypothetical protein STABA_v1c05570 [Spiroplasma tabanidicola]